MKFFILLVILNIFIFAADLDMFDEINEKEVFIKRDKNSFSFKSKIKLNYDEKNITISQNIKHKIFYASYEFRSDFDEYRFNLKELYYKKQFFENNFLELGRINIKEGVSRAFNPSDYFKGSGLDFDSLQVNERRENRLGSLLIQNSIFLENSVFKILYSPKINTKNDDFLSNKDIFSLGLDSTNYENRFSLYVDYNFYKNISSSFILHQNEDDLNFGINLSYVFDKLILYSEGSFKYSKTNISKALDILGNKEKIYQNSLGFNYTSDNNIVSTLEYIYNSAGMNNKTLEDFLISQNNKEKKQLLIIRKYHQLKEEMLSKETIFAEVRVNDILQNTDLSFLSYINPEDKSSLLQISTEYRYKDNLVLNFSIKKNYGNRKSEYGSLDTKTNFDIKLEYFF